MAELTAKWHLLTRPTSWIVLIICVLASVVALLSSCKPAPSTETVASRPTVRLALAPYQDGLVPTLGQVKGWYADEGIDVEIKMMAMTEMQEALAANAVDVVWNNIGSVISTHAKNPDAVYAYGFNIFDQGYALIIRPQGPIKPLNYFLPKCKTREAALRACIAQLKGKTVVTTSHTDMEEAVANAMQRGGLNFAKDIAIRDFNPDEGLAAFLSGTGDAFLGGIPQRARALKEGMLEMVSGTDLGSPEINGFVTSKQFASAHQVELLKLLHVWFHCVNYVDHNMDDAASIIVTKLNEQSGASFTIADFRKFWNKIEHYPSDPAAIQRDILDKNGYAYWFRRWQDCNIYFADITKTIPEKVRPDGVFIMPEIQKAYIAKYGLRHDQ